MPDDLTVQALTYLVYSGVFLGVLLLFTGLAQLARRGENRSEARSRRMRMIEKGADVKEILALFKPPPRSGLGQRLALFDHLSKTLLHAGYMITVGQYLAICGAITAMTFLVTLQLKSLVVAAPLALLAGGVVPYMIIRSRRNRQLSLLEAQLPEALELMARALRVGHPLNISINNVATEMPDPIGSEFGLIFDQVSFGDDLPEAFQEFAERTELEDTRYLAASVSIQYGTGGDLARICSTLSKVIRDRITLRRRIRAISAEGRLTAWFLSALPLVIFGLTSWSSPTYFTGVQDDPLFVPMVAAIIGLTVANALALRGLVRFRI